MALTCYRFERPPDIRWIGNEPGLPAEITLENGLRDAVISWSDGSNGFMPNLGEKLRYGW
jgi:hypothetical protein